MNASKHSQTPPPILSPAHPLIHRHPSVHLPQQPQASILLFYPSEAWNCPSALQHRSELKQIPKYVRVKNEKQEHWHSMNRRGDLIAESRYLLELLMNPRLKLRIDGFCPIPNGLDTAEETTWDFSLSIPFLYSFQPLISHPTTSLFRSHSPSLTPTGTAAE